MLNNSNTSQGIYLAPVIVRRIASGRSSSWSKWSFAT